MLSQLATRLREIVVRITHKMFQSTHDLREI